MIATVIDATSVGTCETNGSKPTVTRATVQFSRLLLNESTAA